jgi:hypothetical protein
MNRIVLASRIGHDGVLRVTIPVGIEEAEREVRVMVEPLPKKKALTQTEYAAWVDSLAGSWQGDFERPPQGTLEEREPLE